MQNEHFIPRAGRRMRVGPLLLVDAEHVMAMSEAKRLDRIRIEYMKKKLGFEFRRSDGN